VSTPEQQRLFYRVQLHAILVTTVGLIAGVMLVFSLLGSVTLWPLPTLAGEIPGSTRGWQAAHVGGVMNGIMLVAFGLLLPKLALSPARYTFAARGLVLVGWGNTVFYWAGNLAANRGLSMDDTPYGAADLAGALAFLGGGVAMIALFVLMFIFAQALQGRMRSDR
jgi:hypothetical protein